MTHDFINYPTLMDRDLSELLGFMQHEKYLENTILFVLSDHGIRFGSFRQTTFQGMVEERLRKACKVETIMKSLNEFLFSLFTAFLFAIFPKSFKQKYPLAVRNFKRNSRRLTTHFDVFETLKDLSNLDVNSLANEKLKTRAEDLKEREGNFPRGISLFLEMPNERTCDNAGIERFV